MFVISNFSKKNLRKNFIHDLSFMNGEKQEKFFNLTSS